MSGQSSYMPVQVVRSLIHYAVAALIVGCSLALLGSCSGWVLFLVGTIVYSSFAAVSVREPLIFAVTFLVSLEIFPPFYFSQTGHTPIFLSFFLLPIGAAILVCRFRDLHFREDSIARGLAIFLVSIALSLPFAWWLSGEGPGAESLSHWLLLLQMAFIYFLIRGGARANETRFERWAFRLLLAGAVFSAGYGIVDFMWPVPFTHPAAEQFIWLGTKVLRRAQGVFYESSNFGNFCGFFLVVTSAALVAGKEHILCVRRSVLIVSITILSLAVLVTFSRSTWASILIALLVFTSITGNTKVQHGAIFLLVVAVPLFLLWKLSPELWSYLLNARVGRLAEIFVSPNVATSGRYDTWTRMISIISDDPQYLAFGIGYKTLAFTRLFHGEIIVDNGYLSLLLETGIVGLAGFLFFSWTILKTFFKLSHAKDQVVAFWSAAIFSFWCGQLIQLLAVDAYTYWRNMVIFAALAALTLNRATRTNSLKESRGAFLRSNSFHGRFR